MRLPGLVVCLSRVPLQTPLCEAKASLVYYGTQGKWKCQDWTSARGDKTQDTPLGESSTSTLFLQRSWTLQLYRQCTIRDEVDADGKAVKVKKVQEIYTNR